jgi:hypothetical protein
MIYLGLMEGTGLIGSRNQEPGQQNKETALLWRFLEFQPGVI